MLLTVLFVAATVALALMWDRLRALEDRVHDLEMQGAWAPAQGGSEPLSVPEKSEPDVPLEVIVDVAPARWVSPAAEPVAEETSEEWVDHPEYSQNGDWETESRGLARFGFEELFGRKLPIWIGGVALAVAGMLIVRYSIEVGLLTPQIRVLGGLLFGSGLIAAAEVALRSDRWVGDARVRQAFSGAGIATLYATILVAANVYHLIAPFPALLGMAGITALAMFLSLRFGAPSALLGLIGGTAAPALIGSAEPNVPLLSLYLSLVVGGLCAVSRLQRWAWLGVGALVVGFGWGGALLFGDVVPGAAALSIAFYLLLLGIVLPAVVVQKHNILRVAGSLMAAGQMAMLVAAGGFSPLHWGLFGFVSMAVVWLSYREEPFIALPPVGVVIVLLLMAAWPNPPATEFILVTAGAALIYGLPAQFRLWERHGMLQAAQIATLAAGTFALAMRHFYPADGSRDLFFAFVALGLAAAPAGAAVSGLRREVRNSDLRFALLVTTAALLLVVAAGLALPAWAVGPGVAGIALALLLISLSVGDAAAEWSGWAVAGLALLLLLGNAGSEIATAAGAVEATDALRATVRWSALAFVAGVFAWKARLAENRMVAQAAAILLAYVAIAQVIPTLYLPLVPAFGLVGGSIWSRRLPPGNLLPGLSTLLVVVLGWAALPLTQWAGGALLSLVGQPLLVTGVPVPIDALLRLLIPGLAVVGALLLARDRVLPPARWSAWTTGAALVGVGIHALYKQSFSIASLAQFVQSGLAERLVWEALLIAASAAAWHWAKDKAAVRTAALALWSAAVLHLVWFTLLVHNPLWASQAVGALPLLNLVLATYGLAGLALWLLGRHQPAWKADYRRIQAAVEMILILLFAASVLRQIFHGSILVLPGVSQGEDISRSVAAILLALAFLIYGIAVRSRDWRIGSLLLMLAAVVKVFLFDAAGLEGLLRIASFIALGFSLIGIGWLYSRYLGTSPEAREASDTVLEAQG